MACAIASLAADQEIKILHTAEVATSFPQFVETAVECGLDLTGLDGP
jgi:5-enolpyruvylshikimate-3-phosphate synthase